MSLRRLPAFASLTLLMVLVTAARRTPTVSTGFEPVSPEELQMTKESQAPGAAAIILFRQVDRDDTGRTAHENNYFRIKILTEEGRKYADMKFPFSRTVATSALSERGRFGPTDPSLISMGKSLRNPSRKPRD